MLPQEIEDVFIKIREKIINCEYLSGQSLPEVLLAEEYGVKRTRIRQILQKLESINFVEMIPGKGSFVKAIAPEDLRDIFEMRESLEGLAAKLAARRRDEREIDEVLDFYDKYDINAHADNLNSWFECATKFHTFVLDNCRNKLVLRSMSLLMLQIKRVWHDSLNVSGRFVDAFEEHKKILEAIKDKNEAKAETLMKKHVNDAFQMFVTFLLGH